MDEHLVEPRPVDIYERRPSDLRPLLDLPGFQVSEGKPNIRGWAVHDPDGETPLGHVEDLLVSGELGEAVFIILNTGDVIGEHGLDYYGPDGSLTDRRILIPLDRIELDEPDLRVLFTGSLDHIRDAPAYESGAEDFDKHYDYWQSV